MNCFVFWGFFGNHYSYNVLVKYVVSYFLMLCVMVYFQSCSSIAD